MQERKATNMEELTEKVNAFIIALCQLNIPRGASGYMDCRVCGGKETVRFICSNYNKGGTCSRHSILQEDLDRLVLYGIRSRIERILDQVSVVARVKDLEMRFDDIVAFDREIVDLKAEQDRYGKLRATLYEDYKKGIISEEDFRTFSGIYEKKVSGLEADLDKQMESLKGLFKNGLEAGLKLEQYKDVLQVEELSRAVLVQLVEKILVYDGQRIQVVLRHQNQFLKVAMLHDYLQHCGAGMEAG